MTAVPNTRRGLSSAPDDHAELLVCLQEHGGALRFFAVEGCVTRTSPVRISTRILGRRTAPF